MDEFIQWCKRNPNTTKAKKHLPRFDIIDFDVLFIAAARTLVQSKKAHTSILQRYLKVGYMRAIRLMDDLAEANIVSTAKDDVHTRELNITDEAVLEKYLQYYGLPVMR